MRRIAIEHDPHLLIRVSLMERLHKVTHQLGALAVIEGPAGSPHIYLLGSDQIEKAASLLRLLQHEPPGRSEAAPTIGLDRNRLDIEEQQHAAAGHMAPAPADARQDCVAAWIMADELALAALKARPLSEAPGGGALG